jgi:hypothetical protein
MRSRSITYAIVAAVVATIAAAVGTAAVAYWPATGPGTATAASTTVQTVTLTPGTPAAQLYPGGTADVVLTISNPNLFSVRIGSLALDPGQGTGGFAVDPAHQSCATSVLAFGAQTNGGAGWSAPAKSGAVDGALAVTLSNALTMSAAAASACQGASFTVYLVAGA